MLASAATRALELIDNDVTITSRLKTVSEKLHDALADMDGCVGALEPHGASQNLHVRFDLAFMSLWLTVWVRERILEGTNHKIRSRNGEKRI